MKKQYAARKVNDTHIRTERAHQPNPTLGDRDFFLPLSRAYHQAAPIDSDRIPNGSKNPSGKARAPGPAHQGLTRFGVCQLPKWDSADSQETHVFSPAKRLKAADVLRGTAERLPEMKHREIPTIPARASACHSSWVSSLGPAGLTGAHVVTLGSPKTVTDTGPATCCYKSQYSRGRC